MIACILLLSQVCYAQTTGTLLGINKKPALHGIRQGEAHQYKVQLQKDVLYTIAVDQQGIDVVVFLKDSRQKTLDEKDSPTGAKGVEKISFSPDTTGSYIVTVKPLVEKENATTGNYTIQLTTVSSKLQEYSLAQLQEDFDILKNAFIECKVGLWYSSYAAFDNMCRVQRNKLKDKNTALDLYKVLAPVTSFTREGHSSIGVPDETADYFRQYGTYLPFFVKIIEQKVYALNDCAAFQSKGWEIASINGIKTDSILSVFTTIEPADGYNFTSKYKWIEGAFSKYYLRFFGAPKSYDIVFVNPASGEKVMQHVAAFNAKTYNQLYAAFRKNNPAYFFTKPLTLDIDSSRGYAVLTVNDFGSKQYTGRKPGFKKLLDSIFTAINARQVNNLVIDIRRNEGGSQGMEDLLLSHLITKGYLKYDYVEIPSFDYSFLQYTDYKNEADVLRKELAEEFYQASDGRYLNKKGFYDGLAPSPVHFGGNVFILISGLTFSGGSEFAALAKNYTKAVFIGEETGGGYYGNTSGSFLRFKLPNTGITGRIPLCKFMVHATQDSIPFGRGVFPDHAIQPTINEVLENNDVALKLAVKLMAGK